MGKYPGQISLIQLTGVTDNTKKNPPNGGLLYVGCLRYPVAPLQSRSILNSQREVKRFEVPGLLRWKLLLPVFLLLL